MKERLLYANELFWGSIELYPLSSKLGPKSHKNGSQTTGPHYVHGFKYSRLNTISERIVVIISFCVSKIVTKLASISISLLLVLLNSDLLLVF